MTSFDKLCSAHRNVEYQHYGDARAIAKFCTAKSELGNKYAVRSIEYTDTEERVSVVINCSAAGKLTKRTFCNSPEEPMTPYEMAFALKKLVAG